MGARPIRDSAVQPAESRDVEHDAGGVTPLERIDGGGLFGALPVDADDGAHRRQGLPRWQKPMPATGPRHDGNLAVNCFWSWFFIRLVIGRNAAREGRCAF